MTQKHHLHNFSLVELILVIAFFMVLVSLLAPSLKKVTATAHNLACMKNLRQIAATQSVIMEDRNGFFHAINYPRSLLKSSFYAKFKKDIYHEIEDYHENKAGYMVPYLGPPKLNGEDNPVYNCPAYIHNPESIFYLKGLKDGQSTYTGFGNRILPLNSKDDYIVGQSNVGKPGPGFIADIYNKPIAWDYIKMQEGWNSTMGSTIHQNSGELPVAFLDGSVKLCFYPTLLWELPNYAGEREAYYRAWYD